MHAAHNNSCYNLYMMDLHVHASCKHRCMHARVQTKAMNILINWDQKLLSNIRSIFFENVMVS